MRGFVNHIWGRSQLVRSDGGNLSKLRCAQGIAGSEGDEDMNDATGDEDIPYDDDEEDEEADVEDEAAMGIGTMQVHDMHLSESTPSAGPPQPSEVAAAAATAAAAPVAPAPDAGASAR